MRRFSFAAHAAAQAISYLLLLGAIGSSASTAEIKVLHTTAVKPAMDELLPGFAKSSGHKVTAEYGTAGAMVVRIQKGETVDVAVVTGPQIKDLQKQGKIVENSGADLAKVGIGVYTRKGAPKRDTAPLKRSSAHCSQRGQSPTSIRPVGALAAFIFRICWSG